MALHSKTNIWGKTQNTCTDLYFSSAWEKEKLIWYKVEIKNKKESYGMGWWVQHVMWCCHVLLGEDHGITGDQQCFNTHTHSRGLTGILYWHRYTLVTSTLLPFFPGITLSHISLRTSFARVLLNKSALTDCVINKNSRQTNRERWKLTQYISFWNKV